MRPRPSQARNDDRRRRNQPASSSRSARERCSNARAPALAQHARSRQHARVRNDPHMTAWTRVLRSGDVHNNNIVSVPNAELGPSASHLELVAWRGDDGVVAVTDARCPHEFTHLAGQGVVEGCELICLAHFWRFDRAGNSFLQGSGGYREPMVPIESYPCRESDGWVEILLSQ